MPSWSARVTSPDWTRSTDAGLPPRSLRCSASTSEPQCPRPPGLSTEHHRRSVTEFGLGPSRNVRGPYSVTMADVEATPLRELVEARREEIKAIVARHHGRSVAIFGSVARGAERPGSDIDFLVELSPGTRPFEILSIGADLEEALGVKVDLGTPESLRSGLRDEVLAEAVPL